MSGDALGSEPCQRPGYSCVAFLLGVGACTKFLPYRSFEGANGQVAISELAKHNPTIAQHDRQHSRPARVVVTGGSLPQHAKEISVFGLVFAHHIRELL